MKRIRTFEALIAALGGPSKAAQRLGRKPQSVTNWRRRGYFPAALWFVASDALAEVGCRADQSLFRFEKGKRK